MVKDEQVKRMLRLMKEKPELSFLCHAAQSGMSEPMARKYVRLRALPSTTSNAHTRRTRQDSFSEAWPELEMYLELNPGLEAKMLFDYLQRRYPGRFLDGQLRRLKTLALHSYYGANEKAALHSHRPLRFTGGVPE